VSSARSAQARRARWASWGTRGANTRHGALESGERLLVVAFQAAGDAEVVPHLGAGRLQRDRPLEPAPHVHAAVGIQQHGSQRHAQCRVFGRESHALAQNGVGGGARTACLEPLGERMRPRDRDRSRREIIQSELQQSARMPGERGEDLFVDATRVGPAAGGEREGVPDGQPHRRARDGDRARRDS
jgi:hypothetical protein